MGLRSKKLVYGKGIKGSGDAKVNRKNTKPYDVWHGMLQRCYSDKLHESRPSYRGCIVCPEWLSFEVFKKWFDSHYKEGYHLDKDIIVDGNKTYSKDTCVFVPIHINSLFTDCASARGSNPIGVNTPARGMFRARMNKYGKLVNLGRYPTPGEAHQAWLSAKRSYCREVAIKAYMSGEIDERTMNAIIAKAYSLV